VAVTTWTKATDVVITSYVTVLKLNMKFKHGKYLRSPRFWDITRRRVEIVYRRFGTTYRFHLQGSKVQEVFFFLDFWPLKMELIRYTETSVNNYHMTPHNIPEARRSHEYRGGSLKSWAIFYKNNRRRFTVWSKMSDGLILKIADSRTVTCR
jgi:hypothetical protein